MLKKIVALGLVCLFVAVSFAAAENRVEPYNPIAGASSNETTGCVTIYVGYMDGPREGAHVYKTSPLPNIFLGITNASGLVTAYGVLGHGNYVARAFYPVGTQFGPDTSFIVDSNGNGYTTIHGWGYVHVFPPVIEVISPQDKACYPDLVPLTFTVYDPSGISWMGYSLDEQPPVTITGNTTLTGIPACWHAPYPCHNIVVYANDTNGYMGASRKIFFSRTHIVSVLRTPITPHYDEDVVVSAVIMDMAVDDALLSYSYDTTWHNVSMNRFDDTFNATIPSQPYGTLVQYKIYANDTSGNWAQSNTYSYTVGDSTPPEIASTAWMAFSHYPDIPSSLTRATEPILVIANATEPTNASGIAKLHLSYRANSGEWWNTTMKYNATTHLYSTLIPGQLPNTNIEFFITAYDKAENKKASNITAFTVQPLLMGDLGGPVGYVPTFFAYDGKIDGYDLALWIACYKGLGP